MFIDYTKILVKAGAGGHGIIAFRRERYLPKGGPSGGDGGRGGSILLEVDENLSTLQDIHYSRHYKAKRGGHGSGSNKIGKDGKDVTITVPRGTMIKDAETGELIVDLTEIGQSFVIARGGKGGYGNAYFKTSRNQSPHEATDGGAGEEREIELELKVIADVGLVGFPNAGKSTLLSRLSAAHPKVADYPFTTLRPHLGIVKYEQFKSFVMADIPGLIEGASDGKGLGYQFLRHIERTRLLLYLVDATLDEPVEEQFEVLQNELATYAKELIGREVMIVLTKRDAWSTEPDIHALESKGHRVLGISSVTGEGLKELVMEIGIELERREEDF